MKSWPHWNNWNFAINLNRDRIPASCFSFHFHVSLFWFFGHFVFKMYCNLFYLSAWAWGKNAHLYFQSIWVISLFLIDYLYMYIYSWTYLWGGLEYLWERWTGKIKLHRPHTSSMGIKYLLLSLFIKETSIPNTLKDIYQDVQSTQPVWRGWGGLFEQSERRLRDNKILGR